MSQQFPTQPEEGSSSPDQPVPEACEGVAHSNLPKCAELGSARSSNKELTEQCLLHSSVEDLRSHFVFGIEDGGHFGAFARLARKLWGQSSAESPLRHHLITVTDDFVSQIDLNDEKARIKIQIVTDFVSKVFIYEKGYRYLGGEHHEALLKLASSILQLAEKLHRTDEPFTHEYQKDALFEGAEIVLRSVPATRSPLSSEIARAMRDSIWVSPRPQVDSVERFISQVLIAAKINDEALVPPIMAGVSVLIDSHARAMNENNLKNQINPRNGLSVVALYFIGIEKGLDALAEFSRDKALVPLWEKTLDNFHYSSNVAQCAFLSLCEHPTTHLDKTLRDLFRDFSKGRYSGEVLMWEALNKEVSAVQFTRCLVALKPEQRLRVLDGLEKYQATVAQEIRNDRRRLDWDGKYLAAYRRLRELIGR